MLAVEILAALALVAANGFFVATEFAIARIRLTQAEELEHEGRRGAKALRHAVEQIDAYLAACQLGITISSIALGIVGKPAFEQLVEPVTGDLGDAGYVISFAFAFGTVTLLHVVLGELAPKSLAIARNTRTALAIAIPMRAFYLATKPLVDFFNSLGNLVLKPFGVPPAREAAHTPHSEGELRGLLQQSLREGLIEATDAEFSENAFVFGDRRVDEILVPRPQVVALPGQLSPDEAVAEALRTPFSRFPVCEESLDRVVGIVHLRDLVEAAHARHDEQIRALARPAHAIPETKALADLLAELRQRRDHMALVLDEYGGLTGIVTLEDLLEEIVGDIADEYDEPPVPEVERLDSNRARIDGSMSVEHFNDSFGTSLPSERFHTVGGLVFGLLGRGAEVGDEVTADSAQLTVVATDGPRIARLEVVLSGASESGRPSG